MTMRFVKLPPWLAVVAAVACSSEGASTSSVDAAFPQAPYAEVTSDGGTLHLAVRTAPSQPPPRGTCTVELVVTNAAGAPQDGLAVDVVPWMVAHGHGTSVRPTVTPKGSGIYVVTDVNLFMPGQWELRTSFSGPVTDHAAPVLTVP